MYPVTKVTGKEVQFCGDDITAMEMLSVIAQKYNISMSGVEEDVKQSKIQKMLDAHPSTIYQGSDGRWCTYVRIPDNNKRKKIVKRTREQLNNALYDYYTELDPVSKRKKITLIAIYPKWKQFKALHVSEGTIERIENDWNKYYVGTDIVTVPLCELDKIALDTWAHRMIREYDMSKKQFYNAATIMKQALEYAVDKKIIEYNPYAELKFYKRVFRQVQKRNDGSEVFSKDEQKQLRKLAMEEYLAQTRVYAFAPLAVLFQFQTVLRVGELCAVRYEDIQGKELIVQRFWSKNRRQIVNHTKGTYGPRRVPQQMKP